MNETGISSLPPASPLAASVAGRAFDGVSARMLGFVFAIAMAFAMTRVVNAFVVAIVDGDFPRWIEFALWQIVCYVGVWALLFVGVVATGNLGPQAGLQRTAALSSAIVISTLVAVAARHSFLPLLYDEPAVDDLSYIYVLRHEGISYLFLGALLTLVAELYRRERAHLGNAHQANLDRSNYDRQMAQARVRVLQAQIEPHFLFNTLANVRRLYDTDRAAGHAMLDHLTRYFQVALPQMRGDTPTLGSETALVESYLNIQQIRIGPRLRFSIEIPDALKASEVPPMMLLTLVENAIKHGIAPMPQGGSVTVAAAIVGERLVLCVADTGRGLVETAGVGTGLANIRARLVAAHGAAATLSIAGNHPQGIVATLSLPVAKPDCTLGGEAA